MRRYLTEQRGLAEHILQPLLTAGKVYADRRGNAVFLIFQLDSICICISTAGVRPDAPWLHPLLARGYELYCGFDDDEPGNAVSRQMMTRHPPIKRLRPPAHDWNDALTARR